MTTTRDLNRACQSFGRHALHAHLTGEHLPGRFAHLHGEPPWMPAPVRRVAALPGPDEALVTRIGPRVVVTPWGAKPDRSGAMHRDKVRALIDDGLNRPGGLPLAESPMGLSSGRLERAAFRASETHIREHRIRVLNDAVPGPSSLSIAGGFVGGTVACLVEIRAIRAELARLAEPPPRELQKAERSRESKVRSRARAKDDAPKSAAYAELAELRAAAARAAGGAHEIALDAPVRAHSRDRGMPSYVEAAFA